MKVRLFGIPIEIQPFFWIVAFLTGLPLLEDESLGRGAILVWTAVLLSSLLVHELGHALAFRRFGVPSTVVLHGMGGTTLGKPEQPMTRGQSILVSLAGPFAGLSFGALVFGVRFAIEHLTHNKLIGLPELAVRNLLWVNIVWGALNLMPVMPYDGGNVLASALGPERAKTSALISLVFGVGLAAALFSLERLGPSRVWGAYIFARGAAFSFARYQAARAAELGLPVPGASPDGSAGPAPDGEIPAEIAMLLRRAELALAQEDLPRAVALAEDVLRRTPPPAAARAAYTTIAWAHLSEGRVREAENVLAFAERLGPVDVALAGGVRVATGRAEEARTLLLAARAQGDTRKDVAGQLIQAQLLLNDVAGAAEVALSIADQLSDDDARKIAEIAFEKGSFVWSARLRQDTFGKSRKAEDAYEAARALAKDGQVERAIDWLRRAVEAGFHDRQRALHDAALEGLGPKLDEVLPAT
jgi:Zn-dependent protease